MRQRDIFWFWFPLFASWLLMSAEGPTISAAINRLPNEVVQLAAQGVVLGLSVMIESPIINMLATSTALVKDRASFLLVRRFTLYWAAGLTAVSILVAFTPLFDVVVTGWLETPAAVAVWVRPGLQIMIFWSAAIAWRRFLQGVLIHFNQTRQVAWGTLVRLTASGGTVIGLAIWGRWPGVIIGALSLMAGVIAEAAYATWAVRPLLRQELTVGSPVATGEPLTSQTLFWFHLPLATTSVLVLMLQPFVTSTLARLPNATLSLAAWPVIYQFSLMARAAAFALPETVIALIAQERFEAIRRFTLQLCVGLTVAIVLFAFSPVAHFYVFNVQDLTPEVGALVLQVLPLLVLFPALAIITSWFRGLLIASRHTKEVNVGMGINLGLTAVLLLVGLFQQWPGLSTAAIGLNVASVGELAYLAWRTQHSLPAGRPLWGMAAAGD